MKKINVLIIFTVLFFILICVFIFITPFLSMNIKHYSNPYLRELKIPVDWKISSLEERWGKPIDIVEKEINTYYISYEYKFDGFKVLMNKLDFNKNKDETRFTCVIIDDDKYKFTLKNIGVGTKKSEIIKYYNGEDIIKDLPENLCGYIIDGYWIYFIFDNKDCVKEIRITYGL